MFLTTPLPSAISAPSPDFEEGAAPAASSYFFVVGGRRAGVVAGQAHHMPRACWRCQRGGAEQHYLRSDQGHSQRRNTCGMRRRSCECSTIEAPSAARGMDREAACAVD